MKSAFIGMVDALNVRYFELFRRVLDLGQMLRVRAALPLLGPRSFDIAIDVGAGGGYLTALLSMRCRRVISCDLSLVPLQRGGRFLDAVGRLNVWLLAGDATMLPYRTGVADLVTCTDVIEHIDDDRAALAELARVLKKGGAFLLTTTSDEFYVDHEEYRSFGHVRTGYRTQALVELLEAEGLRVRDISYFKKPWLSRSLLRLSRRAPVLGPLLRTLLVPVTYPVLRVFEGLTMKGYNICIRAERA